MREGSEEFCLSLIPPAWRLRTENLLSASGVTVPNYPLKVKPQSSQKNFGCFLPRSHSLSAPPLSLTIYTLYMLPYSLSVARPCLCRTLFISVCLSIPVLLTFSTSPFLFLVFFQFKVLWTSWASHHSQAHAGAYCLSTDTARLQRELCAASSILLGVFPLVRWTLPVLKKSYCNDFLALSIVFTQV